MATPVVLPKLGLTQDEGTIVRWLRTEGSTVTKGEPLFEVLTDKATLEVEAPASGVLLKILVPEGATVQVATPIALIGEPGERIPDTAPPPPSAPSPRGARISPRARALAEAAGLDVRTVVGTGPDGRIVERDVQRALAERGQQVPAPASIGPAPPPAAPQGVSATVSPRLRAVIAKRMMESLHQSAQLTLTTEVDMAEASRLRDEVAPELERREGVRPTYTDLVVRAVALALRDHPALNARWEGDGVRRLEEIHIGVAVALDEGLVVPVVRHADRLSLAQIAAAVRGLSERARAFRLRPEEIQGSTFTVTNLGMYDVDAFTPILNPPEAGILGVGRVHRRPVAVGDQVVIRPTMVLSLTFDHRVVDGAPAAQFLQRVKHVLEHPYLLLLP